MRTAIKAITILLVIIITQVGTVSIKQRLSTCPKCLISEKQCHEGTKIVIKNNKNQCQDCGAGTFNNKKCQKTCECCARGTSSNDTKRTKSCEPCEES
jgi:hypothetical protein